MAQLNDLVGKMSGSMPDRLANMGKPTDNSTELVNQLLQLQQKQESLNAAAANAPTMRDKLLSAPGLIAMLGSAAAGAAGAPDVANGLAQGFLSGAQADVAGQQSSIENARKATMDMIDSQRQRLSTMLTSRPDMFIDPQTGQPLVDPRVLGYASTGYLLPINPASNYILTKRDERTKALVEMGTKLMMDGDTADKRNRGATIVSNALNLGLSKDFFDAISGMDETDAWQELIGNPKIDTVSALEAWRYATQNGLPLATPEVLEMLSPDLTRGQGKFTIDDKVLTLVGKFNQRMAAMDPMLADQMSLDQKIDAVFGTDETGDAALMKRYFMGNDAFGTGISGGQMLNMMQRIGEIQVMMFGMNPNAKFFTDRGITSIDQVWSNVGSSMASAVSYVQEAQGVQAGVQTGMAYRRISEALYADNSNMSYAELMSTTGDVVTAMLRDATDETTKRVDVVKFNQLVDEYINGGQ